GVGDGGALIGGFHREGDGRLSRRAEGTAGAGGGIGRGSKRAGEAAAAGADRGDGGARRLVGHLDLGGRAGSVIGDRERVVEARPAVDLRRAGLGDRDVGHGTDGVFDGGGGVVGVASFPTRRSSDLGVGDGGALIGGFHREGDGRLSRLAERTAGAGGGI